MPVRSELSAIMPDLKRTGGEEEEGKKLAEKERCADWGEGIKRGLAVF